MKQPVFLVVDDHEAMLRITSSQLMGLGYSDILTARDGVQALRVLRNVHVDVVLSDWNMPNMHGLDLLKAIRSDAELRYLPFIMITAEVERSRIQEAIACGVSNILVKPYSAARLEAHINRSFAPTVGAVLTPEQTNASVQHDRATEMAKIPAEKPARPTVLVVDDTPENLQLLTQLFKDDYKLRAATSGARAIAICHSDTPPDLVLLDIMMPEMDGFEVAKRMREHPSSQHIPVIFVTAMTDQESRLKGLSLGAVDFVTKPVDPEVLKPRVRNFLRYVELHKQLQADYDSMQEVARLRDDVEQITRHDVRGSLAGVLGLLQALSGQAVPHSEQAEQLRLAEESTLNALDLINLSSELFKIETGWFVLKPAAVDLGGVLQRLVQTTQTAFAAKALDVQLVIEPGAVQAMGDSLLCYSLFQNLLKNACEASPERGPVSIVLKDSSPVQVLLRNQGSVPESIRQRFFQKFVTYGKEGGTGLGAYSARMLAEAQGGGVVLDASDPNATTLIVSLPRC